MNNLKKLKLLGVCSRLSEHFKCNVLIFRIFFILSIIVNYKFCIINYIALDLVLDTKKI